MGINGAILGDIAGSRFEFLSINDIRKNKDYQLFTDENYFTDDSVLSIACMEAVLKNPYKIKTYNSCYKKYGRAFPHAGYGGRFYKWLNSPFNYTLDSFGNGAAMRCSFIGEYANDIEECIEIAETSVGSTHTHPEGIKGARTLAVCVYMAKNGKSKEEILEYASSEYDDSQYEYACSIPISEYHDTIRYCVDCQRSVPVAIRCFYETNSFEECMYLINSMPIDTDTVGAIAGAICDSYYGRCTNNDDVLIKKYLTGEGNIHKCDAADLYSKYTALINKHNKIKRKNKL